MKRIGTLVTAILVAFAFTATTFASYSAEAKTHKEDTSRKKKKRKKKSHSASHTAHHRSSSVAKSDSRASRAPASSGYERASLYMSKHDDTGKHKKKKKKKHSADS